MFDIENMSLEELKQLQQAINAKLAEMDEAGCDPEDEEKREDVPAEALPEEVVAIVEQLPEELEKLEEMIGQIGERKAAIANKAAKRKSLLKQVSDGNVGKSERKFGESEMEQKTFSIDSKEYRNAWLKNLMGKPLTVEERAGIDSGAASGGAAIPTETMNRIITNMVQIAPLLDEVDLMHIPSNVTLPIENSVADAALHTENAAITGASDTLTYLTMTGYEIVKTLPVSAKMSAMAIPAFEDWVVEQIGRKMAEKIENYLVNGTGSSQPKGIDYAETWADGTNAVDYASTAPTVAEIEELIGYQNAAYITNAKFLCNWKTFWSDIHTLRDDKNEPVCVHENGKYFVFGFPVVFSSKVADGDLFFGDFHEGVKGNFMQDIYVEASAAAGFASNSVLYKGACIFDCSTVAGRIVKGAATL